MLSLSRSRSRSGFAKGAPARSARSRSPCELPDRTRRSPPACSSPRESCARAKTFWARIGYYASYAAIASAVGVVQRRPDAILASSPPLPVAAAGALLAARHRAPLLLDIRDLWPESAVALGELGQGALLAAAERLERLVYARADRIVTTNDAFRRWIVPIVTTRLDGWRRSRGVPTSFTAAPRLSSVTKTVDSIPARPDAATAIPPPLGLDQHYSAQGRHRFRLPPTTAGNRAV